MSLKGVKKRLEAIEATRGQSHYTFLPYAMMYINTFPEGIKVRENRSQLQNRRSLNMKAIEIDLYDIDSDAAYKQAIAYEWGFIHYNQWTPYQLTNENKAELKELYGVYDRLNR